MDGLAKRGMRFDHAYCTTASCSASRSVILTGLHNHSNGQYGHAHMPYNFHTFDTVQSIPRLARAAGAMTGIIGKLHVQPATVYPWDYDQSSGNAGGAPNQRDVWAMAQSAAQFFKQTADRPFYLHVGFGDPHRAADATRFANSQSYPNVVDRKYRPSDVPVPPFLPDKPEVRRELAEYYQAIDRLDQGVGFVLDALEKSGRAKDTMVIYMSDHGMPFPGAKGSPFDAGLRCPLIVHHPEMKQGGVVSDSLVSWTDIAPTVLDWMRIAHPPMHGRSLLGMDRREEFFFSHTFHEINNYFPNRGVRTRKFKYVRVLYPELEMPLPSDLFNSPTWAAARDFAPLRSRLRHEKEELFDLEKDPMESRNVIAEAAYAQVARELREKVRGMRKETKDPWFIEGQGLG